MNCGRVRRLDLMSGVALLLTGILASALLSACSIDRRQSLEGADRAPIAEPAGPDLSNPISAVSSYTDWISYAYVVLDSDVATHAFSAFEEVRVNSYLARNLMEEGRGIHQVLVDADYRIESQEETTAIVTGVESWIYRYFDPNTRDYTTPVYDASYDVTYTLIVEEPKGWVVDGVEAEPHDDVQ